MTTTRKHYSPKFKARVAIEAIRGEKDAQPVGIPLSVFEKLFTIQMVEVWIPMLDGRILVLPRHTQPEPDVQALMEQVRITLPPQPPPRIKSSQLPGTATNQFALLEGTAI
jgi:hypothetical protein